MATPLAISIALWYRTRPGDYGKGSGDNNFNAPAVQDMLRDFVNLGLLEHTPGNQEKEYWETEALRVYVAELCNVPFPVQQWVTPPFEPDAAEREKRRRVA